MWDVFWDSKTYVDLASICISLVSVGYEGKLLSASHWSVWATSVNCYLHLIGQCRLQGSICQNYQTVQNFQPVKNCEIMYKTSVC